MGKVHRRSFLKKGLAWRQRQALGLQLPRRARGRFWPSATVHISSPRPKSKTSSSGVFAMSSAPVSRQF